MEKRQGVEYEEDFIYRIQLTMSVMQIEAEVAEIEGYPLSVEGKLPGYDGLPLDFVLIFLPVSEVYGDEVHICQVYFQLYDQDLTEEQMDSLEPLCNKFNMSCASGCYGVQRDINKICYKQGVPIRDDRDLQTSLQSVMDTFIIMALSLDQTYDTILEEIRKHG